MRLLLNKEVRLATSALAWAFLAFSLMAFLPGYPIALGAFFMCMGMFQSFLKAREANDILYSALLPIAKRDVVTAKYAAVLLIEVLGMAAMAVFAAVRMGLLADVPVYVQNPLLAANLSFLACALLVFGAFNLVFVGGFFRSAYYLGKPFIAFIVVAMAIVLAFEICWHVPGLEALGSIGPNVAQAGVLGASTAVFAIETFVSWRVSQRRFEALDIV